MASLKTRLYHLKVWINGDKELETDGKMIPCKICDKMFKSYTHYGEYTDVYDSKCKECRK